MKSVSGIQLAARLLWGLQGDFTHMPGAWTRVAGRLGLTGHLFLLVLGTLHVIFPAGKMEFSDRALGFDKAKWKLLVLLKVRLSTDMKLLLSCSIGQNRPGQSRCKGTHFLMGVVSKTLWPSLVYHRLSIFTPCL